jgi:Uma2 family endonuclease
MSTVLDYPATELADTDYHAFNLAVWERLVGDAALAALDFRIETDRHGQMIMSPPPAPSHGNKQSRIARYLGNLIPAGEVVSECPISTREGVKAADVAWCSTERWERYGDEVCFLECPEICVEVWSPSNTRGELAEKKALYFEEGAKEVWFCEKDGVMRFFHGPEGEAAERSVLVPEFPTRIG